MIFTNLNNWALIKNIITRIWLIRIRKINLGVVKDNVSAVRLYKKLGFKTEGEFEAHGFYNGKYCNTLRMALFAPAYKDEK